MTQTNKKENKAMNKTRLEHLKNNFMDEELTLYRDDFKREGEMEFEYILETLLGSELSDEEITDIQEITIQVSAIKDITN